MTTIEICELSGKFTDEQINELRIVLEKVNSVNKNTEAEINLYIKVEL